MAKVSKPQRALSDRVAALELAVRRLADEVVTQRVTVADGRSRRLVVLEARDDAGVIEVRCGGSGLRLDAGSQGHPVLDVLSGSGADGVGIHLYADNRDDAVGIATSRGGDVDTDHGMGGPLSEPAR